MCRTYTRIFRKKCYVFITRNPWNNIPPHQHLSEQKLWIDITAIDYHKILKIFSPYTLHSLDLWKEKRKTRNSSRPFRLWLLWSRGGGRRLFLDLLRRIPMEQRKLWKKKNLFAPGALHQDTARGYTSTTTWTVS